MTWTKTNTSSTWSTLGRTVYGYPEFYSDDDTGFELYYVGTNSKTGILNKSNLIISDPISYNNRSGTNLLIMDDEIISYNSLVPLGNGHYQVKGIKRGIYDTLPAPHTAETLCFLLDFGLSISGNMPACYSGVITTESLELRTRTLTTEQSFDPTKVDSFTSTRRSEQPSIMANLKFAADKGIKTSFAYNYSATVEFSNDILFTFIGRNKFDKLGIISQTDDTTLIQVDGNVKNVLRISCNNKEFELMYDATKPSTFTGANIVCVGDFLGDYGGYSWVTSANSLLSSYSINLINKCSYTNTTTSALSNFSADVLSLSPDACFFLIGANDLWNATSVDVVNAENNLLDMVNQCVTSGITPIIGLYTFTLQQIQQFIASHPAITTLTALQIQANFNNYYDFCSSLASSKGFRTISPIDGLKLADGAINTTYVVSDFINLSSSGASEMAKYIADRLMSLYLSNNVTNIRLKWADFCEKMTNKVSSSADVSIKVFTYDTSKSLYSWANYEKNIKYVAPRLAGIVRTSSDVQSYADSISHQYDITISGSSVAPTTVMTYEDCPLIFVGTLGGSIIGQDGVAYTLTTEAYRIDGYDTLSNHAILHKIDIDKYYIFRSNFTSLVSNYEVGYQYDGIDFVPYYFY